MPIAKLKRILGQSIDDKFTSIDRHIDSLHKRAGKYVVGALPPIPVFDYVSEPEAETGIVLRRLFPGPGVITKGALYIEEFLTKERVVFEVEVTGPIGGSHVSFPTNQQMITIEPKLPVEAGFRLTVKVDPADSIKGIWTSFLLEVGWRNCKSEKFLLEELKLLQEADNAKEDGKAA
jgi:hypothetical protein